MSTHRTWRGLIIGIILVLMTAVPARADEFFRNLAYGLSFLSAPASQSADRFGLFRVTYEPIPRGWRLDWRRTFGPDAFGRPNSIDLGGARLVLTDGDMEIRAQQYTRGLDAVRLFVGTNAPIQYTFEINTGVQDAALSGAIAFNENIFINQLGFYDFGLNVSNRGQAITDGFALVDDQTLNFDVGPINVSGNIFADVLAAATEPMFAAAGVQNPFAKFSGRATKEAALGAPIEALRAKVERGEAVTQADLDAVAEAEFLASILRISLPDLDFLESANLDALMEAPPADDVVDVGQDPLDVSVTPEPATLTMIIIPTAVAVLSRRRRRQA